MSQHPRVRSTRRPRALTLRALTFGGLVGALAGGVLTAAVVAGSPAQAGLVVVPVSCTGDKVVLDRDDTEYELSGTCGVVEITASRTRVTMPAAQRLVVRATGNVVVAKPIDTLVVSGHGNQVSLPSTRVLRLTSPGSVVAVDGLVEDASLGRRRGTLTAGQISDLRLSGRGHDVRARRGYDAVIPGHRNDVEFRRLQTVTLRGNHNTVTVKRGSTEVTGSGSGNRVVVNRRG